MQMKTVMNQNQVNGLMKMISRATILQMGKTMLCGLFCLLPMQVSSQVNPKDGYIITNQGDTIHGTIDYLKDADNAKVCQFRKAGESTFQSFLPSDIQGYRLADEGIYYVSRLLKTDKVQQRQFAEFLVQGGVSLYRYFYEDDTFFGFVDNDGKEVVVRDDKLNEDLSSYEEKLETRRSKMQQVGAVMDKDPSVAEKLWKMDLTSNSLLKFVKRYDERYCTSDGDCVVFKSDTKKSKSVLPNFYIGVGASYAWFRSESVQTAVLAPEMKYSGIVPTLMVGADMMYPRQSQHLMTQIEVSFTPYSIKANEQQVEDAEARMKCSELALRLGAGYVFSQQNSVNPFLVGGFSIRHQMSVKEVNRTYIVQKPTSPDVFFADDREWGTMTYLGIYASAGVHIGHIRLSATFDYPFGGKKGPQAKGSAIVGIAYRL